MAVNKMENLIELYKMVCFNDAGLCSKEKSAILEAYLALRMFERAMERFKAASNDAPAAAGASVLLAA